jgi:ABC-type antimicrobial peptide transport system permease subunit
MLKKFRTKQFVSFIQKQVQGKKHTLSGNLMRFPIVNIAESQKEKENIFKFRYQLYVQEYGKDPETANHQKQWIKNELDKTGILVYIKNDNGDIVGTMRMNFSHQTQFSLKIKKMFNLDYFTEKFGEKKFALITGTTISQNSQNFLTPATLYSFFYCYCRQQEIPFAFSWCPSYMLKYLTKLGFRRFKKEVINTDLGVRIPLLLVCDDHKYLQKINSPFEPFTSLYPYDPSYEGWFENQLIADFGFINEDLVDSAQFWNFFQSCLQGYPSVLFQDLSESDIQKFIQSHKIVSYSPKQVIMKEGDVGEDFYVILKGSVEVSKTYNNQKNILRILGKGDVFGEMAFLCQEKRVADIQAVEKSELLAVSPDKMKNLEKTHPQIVNTILTNIARILALRLRTDVDTSIIEDD